MKRLILTLMLAVTAIVATSSTADAQNLTNRDGYYLRFVWNDSVAASQNVMFPTYESVALAGGTTDTIYANMYHTFASCSSTLSDAYAVTIIAGTNLTVGAKVYASIKEDDALAVTFVGDGAGAYTSVANKRQTSVLVWDGTKFRLAGTGLNE